MKKRIYLVLTTIMSLFLFCNEVKAFYMYLECDYTQECKDDKQGALQQGTFTRWCLPQYDLLLPLTDKNGNLNFYATGMFEEIDDYKYKIYSLDNDYGNNGCWLVENTDDTCSKAETYDYGPHNIFNLGVCPSGLLNNEGAFLMFDFTELVPYGQNGKVVSKSEITETKYTIYSFRDESGNKTIIAEGYNDEGKYCYAGPNMKENIFFNMSRMSDEISGYSYLKAIKYKEDYWKVHTNFETRIIAADYEESISMNGMNVCAGLSEEQCKKQHDYEVIIDSEDSNNNIKSAVESWYKEVENSEELKKLTELLDKDDFVQTATKFNSAMKNGKKYTFSSNYTIEQFINDLNDAYIVINSAYGEDKVIKDCVTGKGTSPSSSIVSCIYKNNLNISQIADIAEKDDKEHHVNIGHIVTAIKRDVQEELESYLNKNNRPINILNVTESILDYMEVFYTSVAYLDKNSSDYPLNSLQVSKIESLKKDYQKFVDENELGFYPVVDCESLLGEQLIEKINDYLNIFKIAIPILLIGFSILDFTKAIFASDEEKIKKTKDIFIKRIFISILIFLSPLLVNLILNIANRVWSFISPNACGLFK